MYPIKEDWSIINTRNIPAYLRYVVKYNYTIIFFDMHFQDPVFHYRADDAE